MNLISFRTVVLFVIILFNLSLGGEALSAFPLPPQESSVRVAVQRAFERLKAGKYPELYDALPAASQGRISRDRFVSALQRSQNMYQLDRLEIGSIRVAGSLAVVDTTTYGRVLRPLNTEGKIVAQQYLVREGGQWKVATGDRQTVDRFLAANPRFARKFPLKQPRVFVLRDGQWLDLRGKSVAGDLKQ